jgi:AcrR family transcriptional regulator
MDTRLRILQESGMLFSKHGIRSITMDSIATELGISKRTLYEIFKDKDDLVFQAVTEGSKRHKMICQSIIVKSENVIEAIFKIFEYNDDMFGKINLLFFEDFKKYHFKIYNKFQQKGDVRDYTITEKLLKRGLVEGVFKSHLDMEIVNIFVHRLMDMIHDSEFDNFSKREIGESVIMPYLIGISTDMGRELIEEQLKKIK